MTLYAIPTTDLPSGATAQLLDNGGDPVPTYADVEGAGSALSWTVPAVRFAAAGQYGLRFREGEGGWQRSLFGVLLAAPRPSASGTYVPLPEGTPEPGQALLVTQADPLELTWGEGGGGGSGAWVRLGLYSTGTGGYPSMGTQAPLDGPGTYNAVTVGGVVVAEAGATFFINGQLSDGATGVVSYAELTVLNLASGAQFVAAGYADEPITSTGNGVTLDNADASTGTGLSLADSRITVADAGMYAVSAFLQVAPDA